MNSKNPYVIKEYFSNFQRKNNNCKNKKPRLDKAQGGTYDPLTLTFCGKK